MKLAFTVVIAVLALQDGPPRPGRSLPTVDLGRYGLWYEVARFPNSFQAKCRGQATATHSEPQTSLEDFRKAALEAR